MSSTSTTVSVLGQPERRTGTLVFGAFAGVEPAGAALAVDAALGGAIRDLAARRALGAAAGQVFLLPVHRPGIPARFVVFAGLGEFQRWGPAVQRLAAANVTRTLALAGIDDFAMVLWGTTSGMSAADAAGAQAEGVLTALAELPRGCRIRRVTLLSRDARRRRAAHAAIAALLRRHPSARLLRLDPLPTARRTPRQAVALAPAATPLAWLFVQETADELRAALLGAEPKATALAETRRLDRSALERELARLTPGIAPAALARLGRKLGELLLPAPIRSALPAVRATPLVVVHDAAAGRWPWETLVIDGWAPAAARGLHRRYAAEGMSVAKWREQRRRERELRVLLIVNPTGDLPGASAEGAEVARIIASQDHATVTRIEGAAATRTRLLAEFRSGGYDAIHYAGHAFFDPEAPAASGILCAGERVLSGADLAALDSVPALVFCNACESGRLRRAGEPRRQLERSVGFAESFLRGGVANFIGTWWPVSDEVAVAFAATLYRELGRGSAIGPALAAARGAVRELPSAEWANYLHYGSHDFALKVPPAVTTNSARDSSRPPRRRPAP
ncbi:MAG: CHAT domain-containing protein [Gammaproteobacteria bacterium]|nr:MAG: CHAT domain-containing protein [Gammaproteobacteria bacterium]